MSSEDVIEVTDRDGWRKDFDLNKTLLHIGSAPNNEIVLERNRGGGVAPRHLQLLSLAAQGGGYRLVNLGDAPVALGQQGERSLAPRSHTEISSGERVQVGEFVLVFKVAQTSVMQQAGNIGLSVLLPERRLASDRPLEGTVVVQNLGDKAGVQFRLQVEGLEPEWYKIGPGPLLFPNAAKEIPLRLIHPCGPKPPAGEHRFTVRATAPEAYPGQAATVTQSIEFLPFYRHELRVMTVE